MKRNFLTLTLALLISLLLTVSVSAAEYGVIYTETDVLQSDDLSELGEYDLPLFTETYGIDLRVDVLASIGDFTSVEEAAGAIYDSYDYGYGDGRNGMTLTLLVHEDEDGVMIDEWYVYAGGDSNELVLNGPWNVFPALNEIMTEENWAGDAEQDSETLAAAVRGMRDGLEKFVLAGGVAGSIWSPNVDSEPGEEIVSDGTPSDVPDKFPSADETIGYVTDTAGIMTGAERQELEQAAQAVSEKHGFGVYVITVDSFREATDSNDVFDGATTLYKKYDLGVGNERKGVLLLLSMRGRDYSLVTYSDYGNYVFDQPTREEMTYWFLDDFGNDDWYTGFADYVDACDAFLSEGPDNLKSEIAVLTGMIFLIPLIIAAIAIFILGCKMKSVAKKTQADVYAGDGLELIRSYDQFTHATEIRKKREEESDSNRGSTHSKSSGGFGGTSGKF